MGGQFTAKVRTQRSDELANGHSEQNVNAKQKDRKILSYGYLLVS